MNDNRENSGTLKIKLFLLCRFPANHVHLVQSPSPRSAPVVRGNEHERMKLRSSTEVGISMNNGYIPFNEHTPYLL